MGLPKTVAELNEAEVDRVIAMAWEDRTPFEAIYAQFGLRENDVRALMRRHMKASSFKMWRERVTGRTTKHLRLRDFAKGRFKSSNQKFS
ncbi:MAG: TIGR03643 family protein [Schleiferiaceae bacterium]